MRYIFKGTMQQVGEQIKIAIADQLIWETHEKEEVKE